MKSLPVLLKLIFSLSILIFIPYSIEAQEFKTESGTVEFESSVPLHSFTGKSNQLVGKINLADSVVDFYVDVHTLETGIGKRDKDMLRTLEAEEYPFAEFYGKIISDYNPSTNEQQEVTVEGDFTIHGKTRPVEIDGTVEKLDEELRIKASWTINMEDYNIEPPGILFYRVSEKISISINATLESL